MWYSYSETTNVKRIYICISYWNNVTRSETNEEMDLLVHYPQNTISRCIISNETQITLHFFQGRIFAMPEIRADLFFAISKTGMCLLTSSFFLNVLLFWFPAGQDLKRLVLVKISHDSE